jgi:transposase-like protein
MTSKPVSPTCACPSPTAAIRTTNLIERLFVEERRRLKIIPKALGERAVLKPMLCAMTRTAERWSAIRFTEFERRRIDALRNDLASQCNAADTVPSTARHAQPRTRVSSGPRT